jgi:hypothetical protein
MGADALDGDGNEFELKSAGGTNVTTARDVGPHTIEKWRQRYWIIARGPNFKTGFRIDQIYILHPKDLEGWFRKLEARFAKDQALLSRAKICLKKANFPKESMKRLEELVSRGKTLNNPKIPWDYVSRHGTDVTKGTRKSVRDFVRKHPT